MHLRCVLALLMLLVASFARASLPVNVKGFAHARADAGAGNAGRGQHLGDHALADEDNPLFATPCSGAFSTSLTNPRAANRARGRG